MSEESDSSVSDSETVEINSGDEMDDEEPSSVLNRLEEEEQSSQADPEDSDTETLEYEQLDESFEDFTVQVILGQKNVDILQPLFFTKFVDKSYLHCRWMTETELLITQRGEEMLMKYIRKRDREELVPSTTIPQLLTLSSSKPIEKQWWEVDRIIGDTVYERRKAYLVKWKGLEYKDATWEWADDISDKEAADAYKKRMRRSNPKKIPAKSHKPPINEFHPWEESTLKSKFGDQLREYQVTGVNWLTYNWIFGRNTILADEMGLGKTVQTVATLCRLYIDANVRGPFLVVAPMSTLPHWQAEFERWSDFNTVMLHGTEESRKVIIDREMTVRDSHGRPVEGKIRADVVITTYETIGLCSQFFENVQWRYLIADEGHKLKNYKGKRYIMMQKLFFQHCTILTGTPIQNNMSELWSLLHFINPGQFDNLDAFMEEYGSVTDAEKTQQIQELIKPYILRRKKSDVEKSLAPKEETIIEVEMTHIQKTFYKAMINDNAETLLRQITANSLPALQNLAMQLRKVCNHPFLIKGAEDGIKQELRSKDGSLTEAELHEKALIDASGKMILINKLLPKLKADGHKVLIFSQMVKVLEILEQYLRVRGYMYERLDGSCSENTRRLAVERFNSDPDDFVFLLSTKAGGFGINLTSADTVIIHDSDWNPQNDLQAQARCHRIGQKSSVKVYRLITRGTYENEMFTRASLKLGLDHAILDGGNLNAEGPMKASEIEKLLRNGVYGIMDEGNSEIDKFCEADIDQILENRSRVMKTDIIAGGESKFAKATFDTAENETNKEFWAKIIPGGEVAEAGVRRCRSSRALETDADMDVDVIRNMIDRGYRGNPNERRILKLCLALHPTDELATAAIQEILISSESTDGDDIDGQDIDTLLEKYGELTLAVTEKAAKLLQRVTFFRRLERVLYFAQNEDTDWPEINPVWATPFHEYSLLYGLRKFGWKEFNHLFDMAELDLKVKTKLTPTEARSRMNCVFEEFEKDFNTDFIIIPSGFEPDPPLVWREKHAGVATRTAHKDGDILAIFYALQAVGLPPKVGHEGEIDWDRVRAYAKIDLSDEVLKADMSKLVAMVDSIEEGAETIPWDKWEDLKSLRGRVKVNDLIKVRRTLPWNSIVHEFVSQYTPSMDALIAKAPKNPRFPAWWSPDHDRCLIMGLHTYGFSCLTRILLDTNYCFRSHIPDELVEYYQNAAVTEKRRKRVSKPKDMGPFDFLYRKTARFTRVVTVIQSTLKKQKRQEVLDEKKTQKSDGRYVCVVSKNFNIIKFGDIQSESYNTKAPPVPIGYIAERVITNEETKERDTYICETQVSGGKPLYVVTLLPHEGTDEKPKSFASYSPTDTWILALQGEDGGETPNKISGSSMFGFTTGRVRKQIEEMENAYFKTETYLPEKAHKRKMARCSSSQDEAREEEPIDYSTLDASSLQLANFRVAIPVFCMPKIPTVGKHRRAVPPEDLQEFCKYMGSSLQLGP